MKLDPKDIHSLRDKPAKYIPSDELLSALNIALLLGKPLLLTGEPGTGKTDFARYVAEEYSFPLLSFSIRSDSSYKDLIYNYDALAHLQKVQLIKNSENELTIKDFELFTPLNPLGEAISKSREGIRSVVLIDEIDKAPNDLPNDILGLLDTMEFRIPERRSCTSSFDDFWNIKGNKSFSPILIVTSNSEKVLSDAFLRRCIYFHIEFPNLERLEKILLSHLGLDKTESSAWIHTFNKIRSLCKHKQPSTHELIMWVRWLKKKGYLPSIFDSPQKDVSLTSCISILAKEKSDFQLLQKKIIEGTLNK